MDCVVHIGTEKTGTTSIQQSLDAGAALLSEAGIFWPPIFREGQDPRVACYAMDDATDDLRKRRRNLTTAEAIATFRSQFESRFRRELKKAPGTRTVLIVNEHLSRMRNPSELVRLKTFLARFFDRIRVVVYLRRQDSMMRSMYVQVIKVGGTRDNVFPDFDQAKTGDFTTFNYRRIADLWADVFGVENLDIRVFERGQLAQGDVVRDFFQTSDLEVPADMPVLRTNESLSLEALLSLRALNRHLPRADRGNLGPLSGTLFTGSGMPVVRHEADTFLSHFQNDNDYVARTYLGRDHLFEPIGPEEYPDSIDPATLEVSADTVAWHFARLWQARTRKS